LLLNLVKTVALALTSDLFVVLLPFLRGTKSDFLGEDSVALWDKTAKLAKSSETAVQRNSLRGRDPQAISVFQLLRRTSGVQPPETVEKDYTNEGTSPDPNGVNYAKTLQVTKANGFFKKVFLQMCSNI
jgi:hypothetical protein